MKEQRKLYLEEKAEGPSEFPDSLLNQLAIMVLNHYRDFLFVKGYRTEAKMSTQTEKYIMWFNNHQFRFVATEKDQAIRLVYKHTKRKVVAFDFYNYGGNIDIDELEKNSQEVKEQVFLPKQDKEYDAVWRQLPLPTNVGHWDTQLALNKSSQQ